MLWHRDCFYTKKNKVIINKNIVPLREHEMKKTMIGLAALLLLLGVVGIASASTMFTFSNVSISPSSNSSDLTWSTTVTPGASTTPIAVGQTIDFVYGHFITQDFSLDNNDLSDTDGLTASFNIVPPGSTESGDAVVEAYQTWFWIWSTDYMKVDFDNTWTNVAFGNGGSYGVKFNDLTITCDGTYDLTASIKLYSDSTTVPEPGTMVLLGSGLVGLVGIAKRKSKKA
jgi:hypothetical protein